MVILHNKSSMTNIYILVFIIYLVILLLIGSFITLNIVRPIKYIIDIGHIMASGDLTNPVENTNRKDEFGEIINIYGQLALKLGQTVNSVQSSFAQTRQVGLTLAYNTDVTTSSIKEMDGTIHVMLERIANLNSNVGISVTSIQEIESFMNQIRKSIVDQNDQIRKSSSLIEGISRSIESMSFSMEANKNISDNLQGIANNGAMQMKESASAIGVIVKSTGDILKMIEVINQISDQTNILSMNASIEATHAGEAGKGFAVVAREIKKLSENSAKSAKQIGDSLKVVVRNIQKSEEINKTALENFNHIVDGINHVVTAISDTLTKALQLSEDSRKIVSYLSSLVNIANSIQGQSEKISMNITSIGVKINEISEISDQTSTNIKDISASTRFISDSMKDITRFIDKNEENISNLDENVSFFKTIEEKKKEDEV